MPGSSPGRPERPLGADARQSQRKRQTTDGNTKSNGQGQEILLGLEQFLKFVP